MRKSKVKNNFEFNNGYKGHQNLQKDGMNKIKC